MPKHSIVLGFLLLISIDACATKKPLSSVYDLTLKELMEVSVVTAASGFEQALQRAPSNATVISREQWQARGVNTLSQALEAVAGLHVTESALNFVHNVYMIRGLMGDDGNQVKILVDGQPLEWMQTGARPLGFEIPLNMFERIEIVKGPGSAVYGADAFAGVINLVSRKGDKLTDDLSLALGRFDSWNLSFGSTVRQGEHQLDFSIDYMRGNDDPGRVITRDLQSTFDVLLGTSASNAPGALDEHNEILSLQARWRWADFSLAVYSWHNFDVGTFAGVAQALDTKGSASSSNDRLTFGWDLNTLVSSGKLNFSLSYNKSKMSSNLYLFPENSVFPIGSDGNIDFGEPVGMTRFPDGVIGGPGNIGQTYSAKLTRLTELDNHLLRWELGYEYQDFNAFERKNFGPGVLDGTQTEVDGTLTDVTYTPLTYLPDKNREFFYLSVLDEWQINPQTILNMGIRYDNYSDFGSTTNPRVSLIYSPNDKFSTKLFFGSAFRAPSFLELYVRNNPVVKGNSELRPEGVKTFEVGLGFDYWVNDNLLVSFDLFRYSADDLIAFIFDSTLNYEVSQNIGKQRGSGGELLLSWKPSKNINVNIHYANVSSDDGEDHSIAGVPEHMVYLDLHYRFAAHWRWYIDTKWIGDRQRGFGDLREPLKDYLKTNLTIAYEQVIPGMDVSFALKNLFDKQIYEPSDGSIAEDYPQPGRYWMLRLDYRF